MSEVIDKPTDKSVATIAPASVATLKQTVIDSFVSIKAHCAALATKYRDVAFDYKTPKGLSDAKAARHELREEGRYAVQRLQDRLKKEANDLKKTVDAEAAEAVVPIAAVEADLHSAITAREQEIEAAKEAIRQAEIARLAALRETVTAYFAVGPVYCKADGITAERIAGGVAKYEALECPPEWAEVESFWQTTKAQTLATMRGLQAAAQQREDAARIEAQRIENERAAAAAAAARAEAEALMEQARQMLAEAAAAEAKRFADQETERAAEAARAQAAAEAATIKPNAQSEEGALKPADVPATQEADAPLGMCASSEAQAAQASPSGDEGTGAHAEERAPRPARGDCQNPLDCLGYSSDNDCWATCGGLAASDTTSDAGRVFPRALVESCIDPTMPADQLVSIEGKAPPSWFAPAIKLAQARDAGLITQDELQRGYAALIEDTTSEAAPQQASDHPTPEADAAPGGTEGRGMVTTDTLYWRNPAPHAAQPLHGLPTIAMQVSSGAPAISDTMRDRVLDLQALMKEPRESKFPHAPKGLDATWWAALYAAVDSLAAEVA